MTKEEKILIKEVDVVLEVVEKYLKQGKDMPLNVVKDIAVKLSTLREEYSKTLNDLLLSSSLEVRQERLLEIIGAISTISVEDEKKFDKQISIINDCINSLKYWNSLSCIEFLYSNLFQKGKNPKKNMLTFLKKKVIILM